MSKKEKHDISTRDKKSKRIKTHHSRPNISTIVPVNIDCFQVEEQEVIPNCHEIFKNTCEYIKKEIFQILAAKQGNQFEVNVAELRTDIIMQILKLKKMNRVDKHQRKKSRDTVNECKQKVDALNLQYQNLLYEVTHLQKEVTKCLEFRSKDEEIELVPVEEFYDKAPEHISRPKLTKNDLHEQTMARLFWELEQRKSYAVKLKEAEVSKQDYINKIKKLKDQLGIILPTLHSVIEAAEPLQTKLSMPFQAMHLKQKVAKFLPTPLYILYIQACAYKEACDRKIQVVVEGNVDEAKILHMRTEELSDESGDSDQEENTDMNMHRHSSRKEEAKKDVLKKHPMSVYLTVESKDSTIVLEFKYLCHLHIVTVSVKSINFQPISPDVIGNLLQLSSFLNCLFPNDSGRDSPNLSNAHLLRKNGFDESPFSNDTTGWPYIWTQRISGLEFLPVSSSESNSVKTDLKATSVHMESVCKAIRTRLTTRLQLTNQISSLVHKSNLPTEFVSLYPTNVSSHLTKWTPIQWQDVSSYPKLDELVELGIVNKDFLLFNAEIQRSSALLSTYVLISPDYPLHKPLFMLQLQWKVQHTADSSVALRELEEEVNIHFVECIPEKFLPNLLACQMYHLTVCFDVFLETEYSVDSFAGPNEFVREKVVARSARGPSHSRPYKCVSSQKIFTFR